MRAKKVSIGAVIRIKTFFRELYGQNIMNSKRSFMLLSPVRLTSATSFTMVYLTIILLLSNPSKMLVPKPSLRLGDLILRQSSCLSYIGSLELILQFISVIYILINFRDQFCCLMIRKKQCFSEAFYE